MAKMRAGAFGLISLAIAAAIWTSVCAGQQGQQRGQRRLVGGQFAMPLFLLQRPDVQAELKLTDEQKAKVQQLAQEQMEKAREFFQSLRDLSEEERQKKIEERRAEIEKKVNEILTPEQRKRLKQISLQMEGLLAVARKEIAEELKLTDEQRQKVSAVVREIEEQRRELFKNRPTDRQQFRQFRQKMEELRKQADEKIAALLTEEQKKKWQQMLGEPFKPQPRQGRVRNKSQNQET